MDFKTLGLRDELVRAVEKLGFQKPMPIQEQAIPELLSGERDAVGLAQTGTGKTAAFGLPLIQNIDPVLPRTQGIVVCPTRELCLQIADDLNHFTRYMRSVHVVAVYGGASIVAQMREVRNGAQIIVATPGRLLDLIERKAVNLSQAAYAILDEADEMLNMGFQEDIDRILARLPDYRRIWLFSATMPKGVAAIARNYLSDPVEMAVAGSNHSPKAISHTCYVVHERNRYQGLKRIIDYTPDMFGLVFCRTRKETQAVAEKLMQDGYQAEALHGDLSQAQRDYVMRKFRQGSVRILVATDVAARGLDVDDISHVIHFNLPGEAEVYTHRSGRTARAGKSGKSIALINTRERRRIRELERCLNIRFEFGTIPDGRAICEKQLFARVDKIVHAEVNPDEIADYLPAVYEALAGLDKEDLIQRFISAEFNRFLEYYRDAGDINVKPRSEKAAFGPGKQKKRGSDPSTQRFFINVGHLDNINKGAIVRLICDRAGIRSSMIGQIDLKREFSFFEVEKRAAVKVRKSLNNAQLDGRKVQVREVFEKKKHRKGERRAV